MNITETSVPLIPSSSSSGNGPTQHLWDLRWFAMLSAPLLFATIILPLIAGPAARWLLQMCLRLRRFWRFLFVALAIVYVVCYYMYRDLDPLGSIPMFLCDFSVVIVGTCRLCITFWTGKEVVRWPVFMVFAMICLLLDVTSAVPFLMGNLAWFVMIVMFMISYGYLKRFLQLFKRS